MTVDDISDTNSNVTTNDNSNEEEITEVDSPLSNGSVKVQKDEEKTPKTMKELEDMTKEYAGNPTGSLKPKLQDGEIITKQFYDGDLKGNSMLHCTAKLGLNKISRLLKK